MPGREREVWVARARVFDPEVEDIQPYLIFSSPSGDVDHLEFGDVLGASTAPLAVAVRFRTTSRADMTLAARWADTPRDSGYRLRVTSGGFVQASVADVSGSSASATSADVGYDDGEWHWAALRWRFIGNDRFIEVLFDGSVVGGPSAAEIDATTTGHFFAGALMGTAQRYLGDIDRLVVWIGGQAPSDGDIASHITGNLRAMVVDGSIGDFVYAAVPMDEGFGSVAHDVQIRDGDAGERFDGALQNGVRWSDRFRGERDIWMASETLQVDPGDVAPPGVIRRLIKTPLSIRAQAVQGTKLTTAALPHFGDFVYLNPGGEFDADFGYSWSNRRLEIFRGKKDALGRIVIGDMELKWFGHFGGEPKGDEDTITAPLRGLDDRLNRNLRRRIFRAGWEPWLRFNGVDNHVSHGTDVGDVTIGEFTLAVIFRVPDQPGDANMVLAGRRQGDTASDNGYALVVQPGGVISGLVSNTADDEFSVSYAVPTGYADSRKHVAILRRTDTDLELYHASGDRTDILTPALVGSTPFNTSFSLSNSVEFRVGAYAGGDARFEGQIERYWWKGEAVDIEDVMSDLNTPFGDDATLVAAPELYCPLSENIGTLIGDLGSSGEHGSYEGATDPEQWDGFRNGTKELDGIPWPIGFGRVEVADAVLIDPVKQVYAIHDEAVVDIDRVTEGGMVLDRDSATSGDLWINPPEPGEWRSDSLAINRGLFRLGSSPSLPVRADVTYVGESLRTAAWIIFRLLSRLNETAENASNIRGFDAANDATPWECGLYLRGHRTVRDAIIEVASGVGIKWTVDMRDPYDSLNRMIITLWRPRVLDPSRPEDEPQVELSFGQEFVPDDIKYDGLRRRGEHPVYRSVEVSFGRLAGFMSLTEIAGSLPEEEKQRLMNEWRTATAGADDPDGMFLNPDDLEVQSPILRKIDAEAFADEQVELYHRKLPVFEVELTESRFERWIGDPVLLRGNRFGLDAGRLFLVVGVDDDADGDGSMLTLWGGFAANGEGISV